MALTDKQRRFCQEYVQCWNATQAALRAGYSERTARSIGSENLTKPDIQAEIKRLAAVYAMSAEEALFRLGQQARAEYAEYLVSDDKRGTGVDVKKMIADGKGHLIKKIKQAQFGVEIEFYDAQRAIIKVGEAVGLFDGDNQSNSEEAADWWEAADE